jgi:hypothetical protein
MSYVGDVGLDEVENTDPSGAHSRGGRGLARPRASGDVMGDQDHWCSGGIPLFDGPARITARGAAAVVAGAGVILLAAAASYFFLFPEPGSTARMVAVSCVILGLFCVVAGLLDVYSGRGERFFSD